ncbi:hypothetical protein MYX65_09550 [Acidobacteria bacterium AH-259-L09]|nr:hypothetical protein [Acidobacteria bacterium AH-259-L09]
MLWRKWRVRAMNVSTAWEAQEGTDARLNHLAEAQQGTDERLNVLINVVERYFSNGNRS